MKVRTLLILASLLSLFSFNTYAESDQKNFSIGVGVYALNITDDDNSNTDIDFSGPSISLQYAFTDHMAIRGETYSLEEENNSAIELDGTTLSLLIGVGLASEGLKAYVGGGIFSETLDLVFTEEDFSGIQGTAGVGYNWDNASLDFAVGLRDPGEYESATLDEPIVVTVSATFSIRL